MSKDAGPIGYAALLEEIQKNMERMPYLRWLGLRIRFLRRGRVRVVMPVREEMLQVAGLLHGGVVASLIDVTSALAVMSALPRLTEIRTLEMKINYFRPVHGGRVEAASRCLHLGTRTAVTETRVRELKNRRVTAFGVATFAILPQPGADSRDLSGEEQPLS